MADPIEVGPAGWRERLMCALADPRADVSKTVDSRPARRGRAGSCPAAVLIPVVEAETPVIHFIERSRYLRSHAGQIAFAGGRIEPSDRDARAAALREAAEEMSLAPEAVTILGELPAHATVSGYTIQPFVGWVRADTPVVPDGSEVTRIFSVPVTRVLDPSHFYTDTVLHNGRRHTVYAIDHGADHIWGATAAMLHDLAVRVARIR